MELVIYIRQKEKANFYHYAVSILILVFCNRLLIKMSFENRPEMMVAAFGFGSFLFLNFKSNQRIFILISGFLAGLAFLAHLNGTIYVIAGALALWDRPLKVKNTLWFLAGAVMSGWMYLIDILQTPGGLSIWWYQFRNDPATQASFTRLLTHENYKLYCHKQNMAPDGFAEWAHMNGARRNFAPLKCTWKVGFENLSHFSTAFKKKSLV